MRKEEQLFLYLKKEIGEFYPWLLAARPKTLPLSIVPVLVGTFLSFKYVNQLDGVLAIMTLICALCVQIGTNLVNDALDFKKGVDSSLRLGPKRMTQTGLLSYKQVLMGGFFCFVLALLCGIPLILAGGLPLLLILLVSIACGYFYTGGPLPISQTGLSEVFVFLFFGLIITSTAYYLQTGIIDSFCLLAATQLGFLIAVPQAINNLRDMATDTLASKKTMAVRYGKSYARLQIVSFLFIPFLIGLGWAIKDYSWMALLPIAILPLAIKLAKTIWTQEPSSNYNKLMGLSTLITTIFGVLLLLGFWLQ